MHLHISCNLTAESVLTSLCVLLTVGCSSSLAGVNVLGRILLLMVHSLDSTRLVSPLNLSELFLLKLFFVRMENTVFAKLFL